ncbi:MAG: hypothetical protein ACR2Q3_00765 [Woeseiaceae bacterium]
MNRIIQLTVCLLLGLSLKVAIGEELVAEFQGSGNRTTTEFTVEAPWILDWRINSDYNKMISFDLDLVDGTTGVLIGNIKSAKSLGNGVRLFNSGGKYRFRVNGSFIRWHLKIKELTSAEAALYTPK